MSYYDIETITIDNVLIPQLLICQNICTHCSPYRGQKIDEENSSIPIENCTYCGVFSKKFYIDMETLDEHEVIENYVKFLQEITQENTDAHLYAVAHNASRFDSQFVIKTLLERFPYEDNSIAPLMRGNKIFKLEVNPRIWFKDSYLFLSSSLDKLPRMFSLEDQVRKGMFPFKFNTVENFDYVGPIPEKQMFPIENMSSKKRAEFDAFHANFDGEYNLKRELELYCANDVTVLRLCFEKFRGSFVRDFSLDPMEVASTIAGLCFRVFVTKFMDEKQIAIIDRARSKPYSITALAWLLHVQEERGKGKILHSRTEGGEMKAKINSITYHLDGYEPSSKTAFSFHGCFFHGCQHPRHRQDRMLGGKTAMERFHECQVRDKVIESEFEHVKVWECEVSERMKTDIQFRKSMTSKILTFKNASLSLQDGLVGGRTSPVSLYYNCMSGESIHYFDVCSLYPYVMKTYAFPIGQPDVLLGNVLPSVSVFCSKMDEYFGLAHVTVIPPRDLFLPVLPLRINGKLLFPLCQRCAKEEREDCNHNARDRSLTSTWTTAELSLAVEKGYEIEQIHEIWRFAQSKGLFKKYINYFLKKKVEASGFPAGVETESDKDAFISAYEEREGLELTKTDILKIPGKRATAKLCLNSLWGKLAQKNGGPQYKIIDTYQSMFDFIKDKKFEVSRLIPTPHKCVIVYKESEEMTHLSASQTTNIPIASFTTAYGRVELYRILDQLRERTLYFDTDSVIFTQKEGESMPPTGKFLGDLTDELEDFSSEGYDAKGLSFTSTGPKTYSLKIQTGPDSYDHITRAKGLTLNNVTKGMINFEGMRQLVEGETISHEIPVTQLRPLQFKGVCLKEFRKKFRKTFNKRKIIGESFKSYPWGYSM